MKEVEVIYFYGDYYIANYKLNEYWVVDLSTNKLRPIDADCYNIMELLSGIKSDLKNI